MKWAALLGLLLMAHAQAQSAGNAAPAKPVITAEQKAFVDSKIKQFTGRQCGSVYDDSFTVLPPIQYDVKTGRTITPANAFDDYYQHAISHLQTLKSSDTDYKSGRSGSSYWYLLTGKGVTTFVYSELNQRVLRVSGCLVQPAK